MIRPVRVVNRRPLNTFAQVTLDGSGNGTAKIGPTRVREIWFPTIISVVVSSNTAEPVCKIFAGPTATQNNFTDGTFTGSQDSTDSIQGTQLNVGDFVFAVWTGGDVGAIATVGVTGEYQIGL
jgi:hypothetical protein